MPSNPQLHEAIERGHEGDDIREGWVAFAAVAMIITLPVLMVILWWQFKSLAGKNYAGLTRPVIQASRSIPTQHFPEPRLQTASGAQSSEYLANQAKELGSYAWADAGHEFVRIPINRAMDLIAARGLPVRGSNVNSLGPSELELVRQRSQDRHLAPMKEVK